MDLPQVVTQNIRLSLLPDRPRFNTTCKMAVMPSRVGGALAVSDSIVVASVNNGTIFCPTFHGRILFLAHHLNFTDGHVIFEGRQECVHPLADPSCPLARIHWHLINDNSIIHQSNWPPLSETQQLATTGLTEASITNCVVWVSSNLLEDTTFFPHINHCENLIFGPLAGRTNTFFVRCQIFFNIKGKLIMENGNQSLFDTEELCPLAYSPYESSPHTITQRRAEYLIDLTSSTQKLLIKTGNLGGT